MKNILVPTDNSNCAQAACEAAYMLAKRFSARLHILHSLDLPPYWDNFPPEEKANWASVNEAIAASDQQLEKLIARFPDIEVITSSQSKSLPEAVQEYIAAHGIELVVMGSHGASGKNEFFIGSNAQKVIRTIHCPALVIKKPISGIDFRKVVFASSFQESEMDAFLYFKELIKHFVPEIHLVAIHKSVFDMPYPLQLESMLPFEKACAPLVCHAHVYKDLSVDAGVRSFAKELDADLIAISYHERHPAKRMLIGSNVEALVNHSDTPVLTIDFEYKGTPSPQTNS